jgi:hypothetical protein
MRVLVGSMNEGRWPELLAVLTVQADTAEKTSDRQITRRIVGTIHQIGAAWNDFFNNWQRGQHALLDGHNYGTVLGLQIDYDYYPFESLISVDDTTLRLLLTETFDGTVQEYEQELRSRNKRVVDYLDRWNRGDITGDDIRQLEGLSSLESASSTEPLHPDHLAEQRKLHMGPDSKLVRNVLR